MEIIARIHNDFKEKFGIPRQSGRVNNVSEIVFEPKYRKDEALTGILEYSYIWIIFDFSLAHKEEWSPTVRPPRLGGNKRMGVFATRSPYRPNNIGLSSVKLLGIKKDEKYGSRIIVEGADLLDGTPIYDIKPYLKYCDCHTDADDGFAAPFIDHKIVVEDPENLLSALGDEKRAVLVACIEDDPGVAYVEEERSYGMRFYNADVRFTLYCGKATITQVKIREND